MRIELVEQALVRIAGRDDGPPLVLIHAFGDSGHCYEQVIAHPSLLGYRLIVPDLWGFGGSPARSDTQTVGEYSAALIRLIRAVCPNRSVGLIGHSISGSMAVQVAEQIAPQVSGVFSIEGNLTPDDAMFTGKAADFEDAHAFKAHFLAEIWALAKDADELRHYYSASRVGSAEAMWRLGRDAKAISADNALGEAFRALRCPKLYYWSTASTPENTQTWIRQTGIPNQTYASAGHWPMVSQPGVTAEAISVFFGSSHR